MQSAFFILAPYLNGVVPKILGVVFELKFKVFGGGEMERGEL